MFWIEIVDWHNKINTAWALLNNSCKEIFGSDQLYLVPKIVQGQLCMTIVWHNCRCQVTGRPAVVCWCRLLTVIVVSLNYRGFQNTAIDSKKNYLAKESSRFYRITRMFCWWKPLRMSQISRKFDPLWSNYCMRSGKDCVYLLVY